MSRLAACFLSGMAVFVLIPTAKGTTWHVPTQCPTIQAGIDSASAGDTVLVACGTYYEHDIVMKSGVCLRSETGQADCATIDAEGLGRAIYCNDIDNTTAIEGLIITNGRAEGTPSFWENWGGGLYLDFSSPRLTHCVFRSNSAVRRGAGVCCNFSSNPRLVSCDFLDNVAGGGAGLACVNNSSAELYDCSFSGNYAEVGAGLHFTDGASPLLQNCTFVDNIAYRGGGMMCGGGSQAEACYPTIVDCSFQHNTASSVPGPDDYAKGGGLYLSGFVYPTMSSCTVSGNSATYRGGGVYLSHSSGTFTDCVFSGNSVEWHGGGMYCYYYSSPSLVRCIFSDNSAGNQGGGLEFCGPCTAELTHCVFYGNSAHYGGAMHCDYHSFPTVTNCTIFGNWAWFGCGIYCIDDSSPTLQNTMMAFGTRGEPVYCFDATCAPTLSCCNVYGNVGGDWVGCITDQQGASGNMSEDPMFCNPDEFNFHLRDCSPCLGGGCGQIGAFGIGCSGTSTLPATWSSLKALYR